MFLGNHCRLKQWFPNLLDHDPQNNKAIYSNVKTENIFALTKIYFLIRNPLNILLLLKNNNVLTCYRKLWPKALKRPHVSFYSDAGLDEISAPAEYRPDISVRL